MNLKGLLGTLIAAQVGKALGGRGGAIGGALGRSLGGSAGTAIAGALAGMIFGGKKGRALGGSVGKLGGLAVIGTLAWNAYQDWQAKQAQAGAQRPAGGAPAPAGRPSFLDASGNPFGPPTNSPLAPEGEEAEEDLSRALIRAMISAAKADGEIDAAEQAKLGGELEKLQLGEADRAFLMEELEAPADVARVARGVGDPQIASAIYAASLFAITVDTEAERRYLAALAQRLQLDPALVQSLHAKVEEGAPVG